MSTASEILSEFDRLHGLHVSFTEMLHALVGEILRDRNLVIHSISKRTKDRASFERKVAKVEGKYRSAAEVTDIVGIRVITYFSTDVDRVAQALREEFTVDDTHSVDKRQLLDSDRFGYLSLHSVVSLLPSRTNLYEYKRYADLKAEIQVQSILQHAWAEIEHDLGYKSAAEVPKPVRRQFSRLAGLLEIADDEFVSIREALRHYEREVPERIVNEPESVSLDKASLTVFINSKDLVRQLDRKIADYAGGRVLPMMGTAINGHLSGLKVLGIESVAQLESLLALRKDALLKLANDWLSNRKVDVNELVSLVYLAYSLLRERGDLELAKAFLRASGVAVSRVDPDARVIIGER